MKKRQFLKSISYGALSVLGSGMMYACGSDTSEASEETAANGPKPLPENWMWLRPKLGLTDDEWKRIFGQIKHAGIDAVLPEVFNSHHALFEYPGMEMKENLLERLIPLAHAEGLQIHAWMWTMPCNNLEIVENHPEWYAVNGNGQPANTHPAYVDYYKFLDPNNPEVQRFIQMRVEALGKIEDLDGIHLDYVRLPDVILAEGLQPKYDIVQDKEYPEYDYNYSTYAREQFKEQTGIDPLELENPSENEEWRQFRYDSITNLVNGKLVPTAKKYNKTITAAVFPNWESVRQQWHRWDLDAFLPMLYHGFYNEDINWVKAQTIAGLERLKHSKPIYSGLFVPQLSGEELKSVITLAKEGGASGVSLFDYGAMLVEHWQALQS